MQPRTVRAIQRLALCAAFCAGAWLAAEGLDHGTARADDVPIRIEQEQPSERPGGLLDELLDGALPGRGNDETPPPDDDNGRGDQDDDESPPAEDEAAGDNGRGDNNPPAEQPREDDGPDEDDTPVHDVVDEILDEVLPDPPEPVDGDDGSPQHPVDTPPAPDPTPVVTPAPEPEQPATPDGELVAEPVDDALVAPQAPGAVIVIPPFGGTYQPAPYWHGWTDTDSQAGPSRDVVCDSQGHPTPLQTDGSGTRDRLTFPRGLAGPGPLWPSNPCDPDTGHNAYEETPATPPGPSGDQILTAPAALTRVWVLDYRRPAAMHDRHNDALPPSRLTLWPPGPG